MTLDTFMSNFKDDCGLHDLTLSANFKTQTLETETYIPRTKSNKTGLLPQNMG